MPAQIIVDQMLNIYSLTPHMVDHMLNYMRRNKINSPAVNT